MSDSVGEQTGGMWVTTEFLKRAEGAEGRIRELEEDLKVAQQDREALLAAARQLAAERDRAREELAKHREAQRDYPGTDKFNQEVRDVIDAVAIMLAAKNAAYGDSALNPVRVFSDASSEEQIRVRLDDKLSRLARGSEGDEDVVMDLMGYLVLLRIAQMRGAK